MAQEGLSQEEAFARIRLLRSPRIGPVGYVRLLRRFGNAVAAVEALPDVARRGGGRYTAAPVEQIEREIVAARTAGARYLFHDSPDYPARLAEMENAPPILTWRGGLSLAGAPCVGVVGARNASAAAVKLAREFSAALAGEGFVVVSGLARGIDGAAHEGALDGGSEGSGGTIGVIASGIDIAYPPQHAALQERIATQGLLFAEQPPGTQPRGPHFPSRTALSPACRSARWWLRRRRNPAPSSPRGWRVRRGARSWPSPAARWSRAAWGATS